MKGYSAMAGRYLKQQRKRSFLTIIGIVLSVALISALGTMGQAIKDNLLLRAMYEDGAFHFGYPKPEPDLYDKLSNNRLVDQVAAVHAIASTPIDDAYEAVLNEMNEAGFALLPVHLQEGRFPQSGSEVVVENWLLERLPGKPKLGQPVELSDSDGQTRAFTIVGILKNQRFSQIEGKTNIFTHMEKYDPASAADSQLYVTLKDDVDISDNLDDFSKLGESFATNLEVLALMGESGVSELDRVLFVIFGTLVGLVVLSTAAVIYNAFHIAVLERIRQFGLLRTLGATPGQIRNIVFREASTLAAVGIPAGLLVGWAGIWAVLGIMTSSGFKILQMEDFRLTFHWWIMGLSVVVGLLAVYMAAWLPARKASRVSPVEAVRGAGSIVRESYRRVRIPSLLRLIGIEGQMASNNMRRNRSKFRITTFSIVISITLFIVFHYFSNQAFQMTTNTNENDRIAFELHRTISYTEGEKPPVVQDIVSDETMNAIAGIPGVYGVYGNYQWPSAQTLVPDDKFNPNFASLTGISYSKADWRELTGSVVHTSVTLYDEARLKEAAKYLKAGTADPGKLAENDGVLLVQTVKPTNPKENKRELLDMTEYKVGDKITLIMGASPDPTEATVREVTVAGILTQSPFNAAYKLSGSLTVFAPKATFAKLIAAIPAGEQSIEYGTARIGLEVAIEDEADAGPLKHKLEEIAAEIPGSRLVDIEAEQKEDRQFKLQMQIFIYGFLVIIGGIGSLNIINTVQTNLLLRRREIGLLQAVGMTMGQIRRMATAEGVWFGVIGSFWGLLLGVGGSFWLYVQMASVQGIPFEFPWGASLIACGAAVIVGLVSVQGPLRRMEKANLIEELREEV